MNGKVNAEGDKVDQSKGSNQKGSVPTLDDIVVHDPSKPDTSEEQKYLQKVTVTNPRKKRMGTPNEFDAVMDRSIVLSSEAARLRRSQIKLLEAMQDHHVSIEHFRLHGDHRVQRVISDVLKPCCAMSSHSLTEEERERLLVKPGPFHPDDVVDPNQFHFGHTVSSYRDFMEEEEKIAKEAREQFKNEKLVDEEGNVEDHPFLRMPDLTKCGYKRCAGCGNLMVTCHDVVFGLFCVFEVISYCTRHPDSADDVVIIKKIFIDTYNRCLAFQAFQKTRVKHTQWSFVPPCMQDNSYKYALFWYDWIVEGRYQLKNEDDGADSDGSDY